MSNRIQSILGGAAPEDGSYRAWLTCQQGDAASLKLVPLPRGGQTVRYVPYLQPMTIEYSPDTGLLCFICHSTGETVFLEGRGLEELADLLAERRVKSIHVFDATAHPQPDNQTAVITQITIEQSS